MLKTPDAQHPGRTHQIPVGSRAIDQGQRPLNASAKPVQQKNKTNTINKPTMPPDQIQKTRSRFPSSSSGGNPLNARTSSDPRILRKVFLGHQPARISGWMDTVMAELVCLGFQRLIKPTAVHQAAVEMVNGRDVSRWKAPPGQALY